MNVSLKLTLAALAFQLGMSGQTITGKGQDRTCGTPIPAAAWDNWFNSKAEEFRHNQGGARTAAAGYVIPVIVHVIHGGQAVGTYPNLSQAQIQSQLNVLNNDFAGSGFNVQNVPSVFSGLVANTGISFSLALIDTAENLLPEPGIDRINYVTRGWSAPTGPTSSSAFQSYFNSTIKPNTIWDPAKYLNIWISDRHFNTQLLGYATFPAGSGLMGLFGAGGATDDGVWVWSMAFGSVGTLATSYDKGRTATHEIGHWLGLRHIWGDANCGNDFCNDTPTQQDLNFGCPNFPKTSCNNAPNGDMFMNFMDYCEDACMYMFTQDQDLRMQTAMANGIYRKDLTAHSATICTFIAQQPTVGFQVQTDNCIQSEIYMFNESEGKPAPGYSWTTIPDTGVTILPSPTAKDPTITVTYPGNYEIVLTASNSAGSTSTSDYMYFSDCNNLAGIGERGRAQVLTLAPNPASGSVKIHFGTGAGSVEILLHNALGQRLQASSHAISQGQPLELNLKSLPPGVYTLSFSGSGISETRRLIISR